MSLKPHFSPSVEAAPYVFVSGQLAFNADGEFDGGDVSAQTALVLANLETILAASNLDRRHVVKTTVWLRHQRDFQQFNASYASFFGSCRPARSTVVCELAIEGALVEIEAIAYLGQKSSE